jgi:hypothetical protein
MELKTAEKLRALLTKQIAVAAQIELPTAFPVFGQSVAPRFKAVHDYERGVSLWYDDDPHVYFMIRKDGVRIPMISVTTAKGAYKKPFDANTMAMRCAWKDDYDCECLNTQHWDILSIPDRAYEIKRAWSENSGIASKYGTFAHSVLEGTHIYHPNQMGQFYDYQSSLHGEDRPVVMDFVRSYTERYLNPLRAKGMVVIAEPLIYDWGTMLAGQSDVVALDHVNRVVYILDFKTNSKRPDRDKIYSKMTGVLSHLDSYALNDYRIQLCLYQRMVMNLFPGYSMGVNLILWLNRDTGEIEPLEVCPLEMSPTIDSMMGDLREARRINYANLNC